MFKMFIPRPSWMKAPDEWNALMATTSNIEGRRIVRYLGLDTGGAGATGRRQCNYQQQRELSDSWPLHGNGDGRCQRHRLGR